MTAATSAGDRFLARSRGTTRLPGTVWAFGGALLLMLLAWGGLAVLYSGVAGGTSIVDARRIITAVSSSRASSGDLEVRAILATSRFFEVTKRGDEIFSLAPEENLATLTRSPGAFDVFDRSPKALAVDPAQSLPVLLVVEVHEGQLPDPATWLPGVAFLVEGKHVAPQPTYTVAFRSEHHQTLALEFPKAHDGRALLEGTDVLTLAVPDFESGGTDLLVAWQLPLEYGDGGSSSWLFGSVATLGGVLAVLAGLLVVFSPCVVHMTAYFLPVVTGLGMREILDRKGDVRFRAHVAASGIVFVAGFVVLYTAFGVAAGFAGQFFADTARLEPFLLPFRLLTGAVIIYLAFQALGIFRLPFIVSLRLPGGPHRRRGARQGYFAAALAGMSISLGCLVCVGGTLLASLLVYAGASGSPLVGGATLFLFSVGMSIPFLLSAFAFDKVLPKFDAARPLVRYSAPVAGALMLVLGLLILSGNDAVFERLVL